MQDDHNALGLETIRRNRGISLEQIAETTKISVRLLVAIEHGEFTKLPGGIYNTSYIRQYARAIDYDEGTLLAFYHQTVGAAEALAAPPAGKNGKGMFGGYRPASIVN